MRARGATPCLYILDTAQYAPTNGTTAMRTISALLLMTVMACGSPPPEPPAAPSTDQVRLVYVHEVADYTQWRERFDEGVDARLDAGIENEVVMVGEDNENLVFLLLTARDSTAAAGYMQDPATARAMEYAGVQGELLTAMLGFGMVYSDDDDQAFATRLLVRHPVDNFDRWYDTFVGHEQERVEAGVHTRLVARRLDNTDDVFMVFGVADPEAVSEYMSSDILRVAMRLSGVTAEPQAYFVKLAE